MELIQIAGITDKGQRRKDNQDTYICKRLDSPKWGTEGLVILAAIDGVGGYSGGDIAAGIARDYIIQYMLEPNGDILSMLREAVVNANNEINEARRQDLRLSQMCCVLTVAVADPKKQKLYYTHVGDTRLYRFRQGELTKLTKDHSIVGLQEDAFEITEEEAMNHPRRNEILRDVGSTRHQIDDLNFYDAEEVDFLPGDMVLLCSDGLTDMVPQAQIEKVLNTFLPVEEKANELVSLANQAGGKDNITVVLGQSNQSVPQVISINPSHRTQDFRPAPINQLDEENSPEYADSDPDKLKPKTPKVTRYLKWGIGVLTVTAIVLIGTTYAPKLFTKRNSVEDTIARAPQNSAAISPIMSIDSMLAMALKDSSRLILLDSTGVLDTLRLTNTLIVVDSITMTKMGRALFIIPADTLGPTVAVSIAKGGRARFTNITFQGFETVFNIQDDVQLNLKNIRFINVGARYKIQSPVKDTLINQNLSIRSTVISP